MRGPLRVLQGVYAYVGSLPRGCVLCLQGVKIVVFVTGLCSERCFYCPVSHERLYRDKVYVDEEPAHSLYDFVEEAYRVGADGASITGGDPLMVPDRTLRAIRFLKEHFGETFHVHLYTSGRYATTDMLLAMERAGLDEIRFHTTAPWTLDRIKNALAVLRRTRVGVEIPVFPDRVEETKKLIMLLDEIGVEFINLNELEASPRNMHELMLRGYHVSEKKPVVKGSEEAGLQIVKWAAEQGLRITVHYCPAVYKDEVQMRIRLTRKSLRIRRPYERVTADGLLEALLVPRGEAKRLASIVPLEDVDKDGEYLYLPTYMAERVGVGIVRKRYPSVHRSHELPVDLERVS